MIVDAIGSLLLGLAGIVFGLLPSGSLEALPDLSGWVPWFTWVNGWFPLAESIALFGLLFAIFGIVFLVRLVSFVKHLIPVIG